MGAYDLTQKKPCKPVIISIESPQNVHEDTRNADLKSLGELCKNLNFDDPDTTLSNKDRQGILNGLLEINSKKEYTVDVDFFFCVILSHGTNGCFQDSKDEDVSVDEIVHIFNNEKCIGLRGKPKVFIIQADDDSFRLTEPGRFGGDQRDMHTLPEMADMFIYHSAIPGSFLESYDWAPGTAAWDIKKGSIFIQTLCNTLTKKCFKEIHEITVDVNKELLSYTDSLRTPKIDGEHAGKELNKQPVLPVCTSQLRKELYLSSQHKETEVW